MNWYFFENKEIKKIPDCIGIQHEKEKKLKEFKNEYVTDFLL